jgi:prepilin-type N-terminal cleavage/methylation domain-containing protein
MMDAARRETRGGFTLVELVVVVLILTVVTTLAVTRLDFMVPKYRLRSATRQTAALFQQARSRAAATGRDVYVRLHLSEGKFELLIPMAKEETAWVPPETPPERRPPPEYEFQSTFPGTIPEGAEFVNVILGTEPDQTVTTGQVQVRVSPFGASDHVIINFRLDDRRSSIRFNGLTGSISFFEKESSAPELLEDEE